MKPAEERRLTINYGLLEGRNELLLDTDVVIAYCKEKPDHHTGAAKKLLMHLLRQCGPKGTGLKLFCSAITRAEVWPRMQDEASRRVAEGLLNLGLIKYVAVDWEIALKGAELAWAMDQALRSSYTANPRRDVEALVREIIEEMLLSGGHAAEAGGDAAGVSPGAVEAVVPAHLLKQNDRRGWRIDWKLGDALIAACANEVGATLITANRGDFQHLEGRVEKGILYLHDAVVED